MQTRLPMCFRTLLDRAQPPPSDDVAPWMDDSPVDRETPPDRICRSKNTGLRRNVRAASSVRRNQKIHRRRHTWCNERSQHKLAWRIVREIVESTLCRYIKNRSLSRWIQNGFSAAATEAADGREGPEKCDLIRADISDRRENALRRSSDMNGVAFPELPHRHEIVESRLARRGSKLMDRKNERYGHDDQRGADTHCRKP